MRTMKLRPALFLLPVALSLLGGDLKLLPRAADASAPEPPRNYDIRVHGAATLPTLEAAYGPGAVAAMRRSGRAATDAAGPAMEALRRSRPAIEVSRCRFLGGPEVVGGRGTFLMEPAPGSSSAATVLTFLRRNAALYGLDPRHLDQVGIIGESVSRATGLKMVRLEQRVGGLPVFQSETRAVLDREGRLVRTTGRLLPGLDRSLVPAAQDLRKPEEALRDALESMGILVDPGRLHARASADEPGVVEVISDDPRIVRPVHSERVWFPLEAGVAVPAWSQVTLLRDRTAWYTVVDGRTGVLLYRKNLRSDAVPQEARFSVYASADGHPYESPAPGAPNNLAPGSGTQFPAVARTIVSMLAVRDPVASPKLWIANGDSSTTGNNADAFLSRNGNLVPDSGTLDNNGRPIGNPDAAGRNRDFLGSAPRDYTYTPAPLGSDPDAGDDPSTAGFQRGVVTDLFYIANWYHDRMYALGFDEPAGNFQKSNFQPGGKAKDPIEMLAQVDADIGGSDTAFTLVSPDGQTSQVALGLFAAPSPVRDSGLDATTSLHELTHGLTGRLIGNAAGLNWTPGGGLGEGWSDFYGLALVHDRPGDDPDAQYAVGGYPTYLMNRGLIPPGTFTDNYLYGFRRFPYTTDNSINPLTWADADETTLDVSGGIASSPFGWERFGASEFHGLGEIWALSLWEARSRIIAAHGGDVPSGNATMLQIVTDALKMTPIDPSFTDARDALLEADCATSACANEESLWGGFADRGLGYGARDSDGFGFSAQGIAESLSVPYLDVDAVVVDDAGGNGNGFPEPGETVSLTVRLANPWRQAGKGVASATAVLSTSTPGVSVIDASSSYGAIPAQGTATGDPFVVQFGGGPACGERISFVATVTSALGTKAVPFSVRLGRPNGAGAPITFNRTISGGLPIPDGGPSLGAFDTLSISQDLDIADLDFRVDDLRHTFVGQLVLALRSPDGQFTTPIWRIGSCSGRFCSHANNSGDDFIGTTIDDASTSDLLLAGPTFAPFTGSWFPVFNSPYFANADPIGEMSRFNGRSTLGDWRLLVSDGRTGDTGVLNSWSLIVTPVAYACGP